METNDLESKIKLIKDSLKEDISVEELAKKVDYTPRELVDFCWKYEIKVPGKYYYPMGV